MNTTLNQIRAHSPCTNGWTKLLSYLGKTKADDEPLSIVTILESNGFDDALWCLRAVEGHDREIRLYAVWCARQVQFLMTSEEARAALDVAEMHANGLADDDELAAAYGEAQAAALYAARVASCAAARAAAASGESARAAAYFAAYDAAGDAAYDAARAAARAASCAAAQAAAQAAARAAAHAAGYDAAGNSAYDAAHVPARAAAYGAAQAAQEQELLRICGKVTEGSAA